MAQATPSRDQSRNNYASFRLQWRCDHTLFRVEIVRCQFSLVSWCFEPSQPQTLGAIYHFPFNDLFMQYDQSDQLLYQNKCGRHADSIRRRDHSLKVRILIPSDIVCRLYGHNKIDSNCFTTNTCWRGGTRSEIIQTAMRRSSASKEQCT